MSTSSEENIDQMLEVNALLRQNLFFGGQCWVGLLRWSVATLLISYIFLEHSRKKEINVSSAHGLRNLCTM